MADCAKNSQKTACSTPDIHGWSVLRLPQEELGRSIPDSDDTIGVIKLVMLGIKIEQGQNPHSLRMPSVAYEDVGGFADVSVKNTASV